MTISANVLADSVGGHDIRLITLALRYPRFILAEFNTHRMLSRNSASSRAIPVRKYIQGVLDDPIEPSEWGRNKRGMQAGEALDESAVQAAKAVWDAARADAVKHATALAELGLHKQAANRILEPYVHADTVATGTAQSWDKFLDLRLSEAAQPEIRLLAIAIQEAIYRSTPRLLYADQWHLPYAADEFAKAAHLTLMRSVACCARVSYRRHGELAESIEADKQLAENLHEAGHWSPFEHQARPVLEGANGNLQGWLQLREVLGG